MNEYQYVIAVLSITLVISIAFLLIEQKWKEKWYRRYEYESNMHFIYKQKYLNAIFPKTEPEDDREKGYKTLDQKTSRDISGKG